MKTLFNFNRVALDLFQTPPEHLNPETKVLSYPTGYAILHEDGTYEYEYREFQPYSGCRVLQRNGIKAILLVKENICIVNTLNKEPLVIGGTEEVYIRVPYSGVSINGKKKESKKLSEKKSISGSKKEKKKGSKKPVEKKSNDEEIIAKLETIFGKDFQLVILGTKKAAKSYPGKVAKLNKKELDRIPGSPVTHLLLNMLKYY